MGGGGGGGWGRGRGLSENEKLNGDVSVTNSSK